MNRFCYFLIVSLVAILVACGSDKASSTSNVQDSAAVESVVITTAGTGGTFYAVGAAFTQIINNHSDVMAVTNQTSGGSVENIRLLDNNEVEFAFVGGDTASGAVSGTGEFEGEEPIESLRGMFSMYTQPLSFVVPADSDIESLKDLKGKKVSVGAPGSGSEVKNRFILETVGLDYESGISADYLSFTEAADAMKDGHVDAILVWAGVPAAAVQDLGAVKDIKLVNITDEEVKAINDAQEAIFGAVIPAGTYEGIDEDIQTLAINTQIVTTEDVSEDLVYDFVKHVFDNIDDVYASHNTMKEMTLESAPLKTIELHPGAKKYFEEQGILND